MAKVSYTVCDRHSEAKDGVENRSFGFDGQLYEMDQCPVCQAEFNKAMEPWLQFARPVASKGQRGKGQTAEIRKWATEQGYDIKENGAIPIEIIQAWTEWKNSNPAPESGNGSVTDGKEEPEPNGPQRVLYAGQERVLEPPPGSAVTRIIPRGQRPQQEPKRRNWTDQDKAKICNEAKRLGVGEAARNHRLSESVLRRWLKDRGMTAAVPKPAPRPKVTIKAR